MCGIAGWIGKIALGEQAALRMKDSMLHRGPDEQQIRHFDIGTLIHNRLSIIDLSPAGAQPMCNEDGMVWIAFNGEVYNHHELRVQLEKKGHQFKSHTDTEAIIHLYEEKGSDCVKYLRGMFAFAILDLRKKSLLLARDRFGIKPLFYARGNHFFAFASEINALKKIPEVDTTPDEQAIYDYLAFLNVPAPLTFYKGIRSLLPGMYIEVNEGMQYRTVRYHDFDYEPNEYTSLKDAVEQADILTNLGVKKQLESDVPLGALLSGGIDSSLVSSYAQKNINSSLKTFNVKFPEAGYDETWAAVAVAKHIKSKHQTLLMDDGQGNWELISNLLCQGGQPFSDTSLFAVNGVSALMRKHVTVALSGDGGDEGFGGYTLYHEIEKILRFKSVPSFIRNPAQLLFGILPFSNPKILQIKRGFDYFNNADETGILQNIFCWIRPADQEKLWNGARNLLPSRRYFEPSWQFASSLSIPKLHQLSAATTKINTELILSNDFLFKVDTASMKESLEVRVPMLDEDLFAFGIKLPHSLKVKGSESKYVLRELSRKILPLEVANKPKQGFGIPVDTWVTKDFKQKAKSCLLRPDAGIREILDPSIYEDWVKSFCDKQEQVSLSREGLYQRVIMLLALELHLRP